MNPLTKSRIMIADHDQTFLDQLADRLLKMDMEVDFAENGRTAIKLAETETYDLIVTEMAIPLFNGLEILRKAKSTNKNTPVLILSYEVTQDWAEQALKEGAYDYLLRPLGDIRKFDDAVQKGLSLSRTAQQETFFKNSFSQEVFEGFPYSQSASPTNVGGNNSETRPGFQPEITHPSFEVPAVPSSQMRSWEERPPWEQPKERIASLPEGVIELNAKGQILNCSPAARNWLMLEARSPEKPIKQFIKVLGGHSAPDKMRVHIGGRQVHLLTKNIQDRTGSKRMILMIREAKAVDGKFPQSPVSTNTMSREPSKPAVKQEFGFSGSLKKYSSDVQERGWSPLGFLDQMKQTIKDEVDKIKEQNPFELFETKPEEVDPEVVFTMSQRLSDISRGRRSSF